MSENEDGVRSKMTRFKLWPPQLASLDQFLFFFTSSNPILNLQTPNIRFSDNISLLTTSRGGHSKWPKFTRRATHFDSFTSQYRTSSYKTRCIQFLELQRIICTKFEAQRTILRREIREQSFRGLVTLVTFTVRGVHMCL